MQLALARVGLEPDLQRVVLIEMEVEFDLRRHLAQMDFHLLLQMRIAAQERRQKLARRGDIDRAHAALERQRHERTRRPFREAIEAMLHANELQLGPADGPTSARGKGARFPAARASRRR